MQKIIHICNNFISSKVHRHLCVALAGFEDVLQVVYVPVRRSSDIGVNRISDERVEFKYAIYPRFGLRFFPFFKVLFNFLKFSYFIKASSREANERGGLILAHTLWSDGAIAYLSFIFFKTPYIVVLRNSDLNWFIPKLPHYRWLVRRIIASAQSVIFVSPVYERRFLKGYPELHRAAKRTAVIPNGIDEFWLENALNIQVKRELLVLFVGRFDRNKNLTAVVKASALAREVIPGLRLLVVGGQVAEFLRLANLREVPDWISVQGHLDDRAGLSNLYRKAGVLLVPSFHETFGLVYLEAVSQGCPIIYTAGEGVDGLLEGADFARSVDPMDYLAISQEVVSIIQKYPNGVSPEKLDFLRSFDWKAVAQSYLSVIK